MVGFTPVGVHMLVFTGVPGPLGDEKGTSGLEGGGEAKDGGISGHGRFGVVGYMVMPLCHTSTSLFQRLFRQKHAFNLLNRL